MSAIALAFGVCCVAPWAVAILGVGGAVLLALRTIVHALRGWPTPLGATVNSAMKPFDDAGALKDPRDIWQVETVAQQVVAFAKAFGG